MKCFIIIGLAILSSHAKTQDAANSHYLFPEFKEGFILMNDGLKHQALLNYNSLTEEMIFESEGKKLAIASNELAMIDTVYINERKFIPSGKIFIELLFRSTWELYAEHKCELRELGQSIGYGSRSRTTSISSYSSVFSQGQLYDLKLPETFEIEPVIIYWIKKEAESDRVSNMNDLKKLYKDKKDLLKAYVKSNGIQFGNQDDITRLIGFLNQ